MQRTKSIAWQCTTDVQLRPDAILCKSIPRVPITPPQPLGKPWHLTYTLIRTVGYLTYYIKDSRVGAAMPECC